MNRGAAGRPLGTDGSDFSYRMTVDDKYKRAAKARMHLRKFLVVQAVFVLLKAIWATLKSLNGEPANTTTVAACISGGAAVFFGTIGLKTGASPHLLKLYLLLTGTSLSLDLLPLMTGQFFTQWSDIWQSTSKKDTNKLVLVSLQGLQEIAGIIAQLLSASAAFSLSKNISLKRS